MRSILLTLGRDDPAAALGMLAATAVDRPEGGHLLRKGQRVGAAEVDALAAAAAAAPGTVVSLLALDADDMDEIEAAQQLGAALTGPGVQARPPGQGRTRLVAAHAGLFQVDRARLAAANAVPDLNIYTLFDGTPVPAGTAVAEAKITPLAAPRARVAAAVGILTAGPEPVLTVRPFMPRRAGLLLRERLAPAAAARLVTVLQKKLAWFGTSLAPSDVVYAANDRGEVAGLLAGLRAQEVDLVLTAGGSASDPADPTLGALADLGAVVLRHGVPIHPGSLLWVARHGEALIVGVPSCGTFSEQTSLDVLLPRLLALGPAGLAGIEALAEGGLLTRGMEHRFPPYGALE